MKLLFTLTGKAAGEAEKGKLGFGHINVVMNVKYPNVDVTLADEFTNTECQEKKCKLEIYFLN